ncbi:MAG: helix-turn-helix domain-containing protein [Clostridia bacterium]|nr:helix-turn-helix domain-containing protein [Clostridia bacterium]
MDANKIGSFIKELRASKNMTQKDLAEIINCTDKAISRWETGRGVPEVSLLMPLSKALGVSVNELLMGERFNSASSEFEKEETKEQICLPAIISKTDKTIVSVIMEKDEEIKTINKSKWIFMILCCAQVLILFVIPSLWQMHKGWDAAEFIVLASMINAFLVGLVRDRIKWIFPFFGTLIVISAIIFGNGEEMMGLSFSLWFAIGAAVIMAVSSVIRVTAKFIAKKTGQS